MFYKLHEINIFIYEFRKLIYNERKTLMKIPNALYIETLLHKNFKNALLKMYLLIILCGLN